MSYRLLHALLAVVFMTHSGPDGWKAIGKPRLVIGGINESYMHPVWSPRGNRLAFTKPGYRGIWVKNLDDDEITQITDDPAAGFGFSWSHSGKAIVSRTVVYEGRKRSNALRVYNLQNGKATTLSEPGARFRGVPRWTADDTEIYVVGRRKLAVFSSGLGVTEIDTPTSQQMCYLKSGKIAITQSKTEVASIFEPVQRRRYINLALSPAGDRLAFEVMGGNLFVMNIDGTGLVDLGRGYRAQWAPDGQYLVYMITENDGHRFTSSDIYTIRIDATEKTNITDTKDKIEMNPSWSSDGKRIAFDTYNEGAIYVVEVGN